MPPNSGFITLHRDIRDHWIFKDAEQFRAWVSMLMMANWEDREVPCGTAVTTCKRGQFIRSQRQLAETFGWTRSKVQRFLKLLQNANMIRSEIAHKAIMITIVNYSAYQDVRSKSEQKMSTKRAEDEQIVGTENNTNQLNHSNHYNTDPSEELFNGEPSKGVVDEEGVFRMEALQQWCIDVRALGGKVYKDNWRHWKRMVDDHGLETLHKAISATKADERWPDKVESKIVGQKALGDASELKRNSSGRIIV